MKKKVIGITSFFSVLLVSVLVIYINNIKVKLDKNIAKIIIDTYDDEDKFEMSSLEHEGLCNTMVNNYSETINKINGEKDKVKHKEIKSILEQYTSGLKIRTKAYEAYKINDLDQFEKFLVDSDKLIDPALIRLVEDYNLKIYNTDYYKFITSK